VMIDATDVSRGVAGGHVSQGTDMLMQGRESL